MHNEHILAEVVLLKSAFFYIYCSPEMVKPRLLNSRNRGLQPSLSPGRARRAVQVILFKVPQWHSYELRVLRLVCSRCSRLFWVVHKCLSSVWELHWLCVCTQRSPIGERTAVTSVVHYQKGYSGVKGFSCIYRTFLSIYTVVVRHMYIHSVCISSSSVKITAILSFLRSWNKVLRCGFYERCSL